jgi:hypothetical protein
MMNPETWKDFFVAVAGSASALAGLVFVALSINLARILNIPGLPGRGGETIVLLAAVLIMALIALVPGQSSILLGIEFGLVALAAWGMPVNLHRTAAGSRHYKHRWQFVLRIALHQAATVPLLIASGLFLASANGAAYWLALGLILVLAVALYNAWVLLVEIMR